MVAIFTGLGAGAERGSGNVLGRSGLLGGASLGRSAEQVLLNAATGNLMIQQKDEMLVGLGPDASVARTYNSLGDLSDENGDNWRQSTDRRVYGQTGTLNQAGSTIKRVSADGSEITYSWDTTKSAYVAKDGSGAYDTLTWNSGTSAWTWTDGSSQLTETYGQASGSQWLITRQTDTSGNAVTFSYVAGTSHLDKVTTADGSGTQYLQYSWSGNNITQITTGYTDLVTSTAKTLTRTRYTYDGSNRLSTVTVDLTPNDNSIADGKVYTTTYTYVGATKMVATITETDGSSLTIGYDGSNRVHTLTQAVAGSTTRVTTIDYYTGYSTVTDATGQVTRLDYDANDNLTKITAPSASVGLPPQVTMFTYDASGNVTSVVDPLGNTTSYSNFTANGVAQTITDPLGNVTTRTYGSKNELLTETVTGDDQAGTAQSHTTRYVYDANDRLAFSITPDGNVVEHRYTQAGEWLTLTYVGQLYDTSGLTSSQAPTLTQMNSWVSGLSDPTAVNQRQTTYDSRGNIKTVIAYGASTSPGNASTANGYSYTDYVYDQAGQLLSRRDYQHAAETFVYDGLGRVVASVDLQGSTTSVLFDDANAKTIVTLANGLTQTSTYNKAGDLIVSTQSAAATVSANFKPDLTNASQWTSSNLNASAATIDGVAATKYQISSTNGGLTTGPFTVAAGDTLTWEITVMGVTGSLSDMFGFNGSSSGWGDGSQATATILSGPGSITVQNASGPSQISGLSASTGTRVRITRTFQTAETVYGFFYVKAPNSGTTADGVVLSSPNIVKTTAATIGTNLKPDLSNASQWTAGNVTATSAGMIAGAPATQFTSTSSGGGLATGSFTVAAGDTMTWEITLKGSGTTLQDMLGFYGSASGWGDTAHTTATILSGPGSFTGQYLSLWTIGNLSTTTETRIRITRTFTQAETVSGYFYVKTSSGGAAGDSVILASPNIVKTTAADPQVTVATSTYGYDQLGRLRVATDATQHNSYMIYDNAGRKVGDVDHYGVLTEYKYDADNRLIATVRYATALTSAQLTTLQNPNSSFDLATNRPASSNDDLWTFNVYDKDGRRIETIDGAGEATAYSYDASGKLTGTTAYANKLTATQIASLKAAVSGANLNPDLSNTNQWLSGGVNVSSAGTINGAPATQYTVQATGAGGSLATKGVIAVTSGDALTFEITLQGVAAGTGVNQTLSDMFGFYGSSSGWGDIANMTATVVSGPGSLSGATGGPWGISGLQTGTPTRIRLTRKFTTTENVSTYFYVKTSNGAGSTAGDSVILASPSITRAPNTTLTLPTADAAHDKSSRIFYDKTGRVVGTLDGEGYLSTNTYDAGGFKIAETAYANKPANGATASFATLAAGTSAADRTTHYVYDNEGLLTFVVDAQNHVTEYVYPGQSLADVIGRPTKTVQYAGTIGSPSVWTVAGVRAAINAVSGLATNSSNRVSQAVYDAHENLIYAIDPAGGFTAFAYDNMGHVTKTVRYATVWDGSTPATFASSHGSDANNRTTRGYYDARGDLTFTVDGEGYVTRYDYDAEDRQVGTVRWDNPVSLASVTDATLITDIPALVSSSYTATATSYDMDGRVATTTDGEGAVTSYLYNANGTLNTKTEGYGTPDAVQTYYVYDAAGRVVSRYDAYGSPAVSLTQFAYNAFGQVVTTTDPLGNTVTNIYDRDGRLTSSTDQENLATSYQYNAFDQVTATTDPRGNTVYAYYDILGRVTATRDADNRVTETGYTVFGEIQAVTHRFNLATGSTATAPSVTADGRDVVTSYTYDKDGRLLTTTDAENGVTTVTYTAFGEVATETDPFGTSTTIQTTNSYDRRGLLKTRVVDSASGGKAITTNYGYDAFGRQISLTNALSKVSSATYDRDGRLKSKTDPLGNVTSYTYDKRGNLVAVTDAASKITRFVYDSQDRKVATIDALGAVTVNTYDTAGNLIAARTYATALSSTILAGLPVQATSSAWSSLSNATTDHVTFYTYDKDGRLRFTVDALGHVTERAYDADGNVVHTTAYDGGVAPASYSLTAITAAVAGMPSRGTRSVYDAAGQLMFSIDMANEVTGFTYDAFGNVIKQVEFAAPYTPAGDPTLATMTSWVTSNANATNDRTTRAYYDHKGQLRYSIDALGYVTEIDYDKAGNVIKQTAYATAYSATDATTLANLDSNYATTPTTARVTQFGYDSAGRLETTTVLEDSSTTPNSISITTKLVRDQLGQITSSTEAFGTGDASTTIYVYDDAGRVVKQTRGDGTAETSTTWFFYDALGRKAATVDGDNYLTVWSYDAAGQTTGQTHYANKITGSFTSASTVAALQALAGTNANDATTSTAYDALGRVSSTTDARGSVTSNSYDAIDELTSSTQAMETGTADDITTSYTYDNFGNVIKTVDPRGNASFAYYDTLHRVIRQVDAEKYVTDTSYTRGGQVSSVKRWANALTGTVSETVFPANPTADAVHDATTTFDYDKDDRLTATHDAESYSESYLLDAFGDRTSVTNKIGGTSTYAFNKRGLLLTETLPVTTKTGAGATINVINAYSYDLRGNRTQMVEASGAAEARTTNYAYDDLDRLIQTTHDAVSTMTLTDTGLVAATNQTPTETVKYDDRGDVIESVDAAGARTLNWYDAFGNVVATVAQSDLVAGVQKGALSVFTYDKNGNRLTAKTYGDLITLPADSTGAQPSPVNGSNFHQTSYAYDRADRLTSTTVASLQAGEWNGSNYVLTTADVVSSTEYDKNGNVTRQVDGRGNSTYTWYDKLGRQTAQVDAENYMTVWTRDAEGNALSETRYATKLGAFTPGATAPATPSASNDDRTTQFTYDRNGRRTEERRLSVAYTTVSATGVATDVAATDSTAVSKVNYTYNGLGEVLTKVEANIADATISTTARDTTTYQYDAIGRLVLEQDQAFKSSQWVSGGADAQPTTAFVYDGLNNLKSSRVQAAATANDSNDRITAYTYGAGGRLASTTDANGFTHTYSYDIAGRQVLDSYTRTKSDGTTVTEGQVTRYDLAGRVITQTNARNTGSAWVFTSELAGNPAYDAVRLRYDTYGEMTGRGITVATPGTAAAYQEVFDYDAGGRLWHSNSGDGVDRFYVYDKAGNQTLTLTSAGADLSALTAANYTASINSAGDTTTANAVTTLTTYDKRGSATGTLSPDRLLATGGSAVTVTTGKSYNAFGEVASETDERGYTTSYTYNTMGRMVSKVMPQVSVTAENGGQSNVNPTEYYGYDLAGRLVSVTDANGNRTTRVLLAGSGHGDADPLVILERHPDSGTVTTRFNVFGDAVSVTNEMGNTTTNGYDKMGRLITVTHPNRVAGSAGNETGVDQQLVDHYVYDQLGQRTGHWNSQLTASVVEKTDYDVKGRVVATKSFTGEGTTYAYSAYNASAVTSGLGTFGGWTKTTTNVTSAGATIVSAWEVDDYFGRTVDSQDFGAHNYDYTFNKAGQLTARANSQGESIGFTYYNTGQLSGQTGTQGTATYGYDAAGNRIKETFVEGGVTYRDASATFDALGRMTHWQDQAAAVGGSGTTTNPIATDWEYDANGNVRRANASYRGIDASGTITTSGSMLSQDNWYTYDTMNRVLLSQGQFTGTRGSGTISRGANGIQIAYNFDGTRASTLRETAGLLWSGYRVHDKIAPGDWWYSDDAWDPGDPYQYISQNTTQSFTGASLETYGYSADGQLVTVSIANEIGTAAGNTIVGTGIMTGSALSTQIGRDALGRITHYVEGGGSYQRTNIVYDNANRELSETSYTNRSDGSFQTDLTNTYTNGQLTSQAQRNYKNGSDSSVPDTLQSYSYQYWDGALQSGISYDSDTGSSSNAVWNTSYTYDSSGHIVQAHIADGQPRDANFVTDQQGLIIDRTEQKLAGNTTSLGNPRELHYRFGGLEMGQVGNNGTTNVSYVASTANRLAKPNSGTPGAFANGATTASPFADFDQNYDAINGSSIGNAASTYTVQGNESFSSIAAQIWGDANLWYVIANANGMTGSETLVAGQTLVIPNNVTSSRNTSETFKPYNPNEAIGDTSPTTAPQPPKNSNKCGSFGQILVSVVAIAVSVALSFTPLAPVAPIIGNVVSQGFGIAIGAQTSFNWSSLAISAITTGVSFGLDKLATVGGQLGSVGQFLGGSGILNVAANGVVSNVLTQGIAIATGLQQKFDWTGVAAAGVTAAVTSGIARVAGKALHLGTGTGKDFKFNSNVSKAIANGVGGFAGNLAASALRSVVDGSDFGDNLITTLPQTLTATVGNIIGNEINDNRPPKAQAGTTTSGQTAPGGAAASSGATNAPQPDVAYGGHSTDIIVTGNRRSSGYGIGNYIRDSVSTWEYNLLRPRTIDDIAADYGRRNAITPATGARSPGSALAPLGGNPAANEDQSNDIVVTGHVTKADRARWAREGVPFNYLSANGTDPQINVIKGSGQRGGPKDAQVGADFGSDLRRWWSENGRGGLAANAKSQAEDFMRQIRADPSVDARDIISHLDRLGTEGNIPEFNTIATMMANMQSQYEGDHPLVTALWTAGRLGSGFGDATFGTVYRGGGNLIFGTYNDVAGTTYGDWSLSNLYSPVINLGGATINYADKLLTGQNDIVDDVTWLGGKAKDAVVRFGIDASTTYRQGGISAVANRYAVDGGEILGNILGPKGLTLLESGAKVGNIGRVFDAAENTFTATAGRNTATFVLDVDGAPISASGNLQEYFSGATRGSAEVQAQAEVGALGNIGDHGGHLVDHRFLLDQGRLNMFPQEGNFNLSAYKTLGNDYARLIDKGYSVDFNHVLGDFDAAGRPGSLSVTYRAVDQQGVMVDSWSGKFLNQPGQVYARRVH